MAKPLFDLRGLFQALNAERERRQLSWAELGRQVGVAPSTIRRFNTAEDAEADGVLAALQWLDAIPEDYIAGDRTTGARLPAGAEGHVRVDMKSVAKVDSVAVNGRTRTTIQNLAVAADRAGRTVASLTRITDI